MMKTAHFAIFAALLAAAPAFAADYAVDPVHTSVEFTVRHLVSHVTGKFKDFSGNFSFDEKNPAKSSATFEIKTASIDTGNPKRDGHLRSGDFFDAEKNPTITFKSTKVTPAGKGKYKMAGDLTMRGVTKPVTLTVDYGGSVKDPMGTETLGFTLTGKVNRKEFGINWNKTLDNGGLMLSDDVMLNIEVEAKPAKTQKM